MELISSWFIAFPVWHVPFSRTIFHLFFIRLLTGESTFYFEILLAAHKRKLFSWNNDVATLCKTESALRFSLIETLLNQKLL